jgi:hypothetical protein
MTVHPLRGGKCTGWRRVVPLFAALFLAACAIPPDAIHDDASVPVEDPWRKKKSAVTVDETAMLPLLGYHQLLMRMSPQELLRERTILASIPQTPAVGVRLAMLLGQPRGPMDLFRAQGLLENILKSSDPAAASLHPLARALAAQYGERLKLEMQNEKLNQQLKESQRRNSELQEKLDALADIERTLPVRPAAGDNPPGVPR